MNEVKHTPEDTSLPIVKVGAGYLRRLDFCTSSGLADRYELNRRPTSQALADVSVFRPHSDKPSGICSATHRPPLALTRPPFWRTQVARTAGGLSCF
jgi:hypothetical protein